MAESVDDLVIGAGGWVVRRNQLHGFQIVDGQSSRTDEHMVTPADSCPLHHDLAASVLQNAVCKGAADEMFAVNWKEFPFYVLVPDGLHSAASFDKAKRTGQTC